MYTHSKTPSELSFLYRRRYAPVAGMHVITQLSSKMAHQVTNHYLKRFNAKMQMTTSFPVENRQHGIARSAACLVHYLMFKIYYSEPILYIYLMSLFYFLLVLFCLINIVMGDPNGILVD